MTNPMQAMTFELGGGGGDFPVAPEGQQIVVCVDGLDLGYKVDEYEGAKKLVRKYVLVFQSEETDEKGKRHTIVREFTASMSEKGNLRKFVQAWLGKTLTDEQAKAFNIGEMYGRCGLGSVIHKTSRAGKKRAELMSVAPLFRGVPPIEPAGYERPKFLEMRKADYAKESADYLAQRDQKAAATAARTPDEAVASALAADNDELPF